MDAPDWQAERLRFTAFLTPESRTPSLELWAELAGGLEPDIRQQQPREGVEVATGVIDGVQRRIMLKPDRMDLYLEPASPDPGEHHEMPNIGGVDQALALGRSLVKGFSRGSDVFRRIAVAPSLHLTADSDEATGALLKRMLPAIDFTGIAARDFRYRVNRRLESSDIGFYNRLSEWSVGKWVVNRMGPDPRSASRLHETPVILLTIDVSTPADSDKPLDASSAAQVFLHELDLAEAIAKEGDVRR